MNWLLISGNLVALNLNFFLNTLSKFDENHFIFSHWENDWISIQDLIATELINVLAEIRKYWWENSDNLINVPGTAISDSRVEM